MSINERIYIIDQLLSGRRFVTVEQLMEKLEVSRATLKRDLSLLRDRFHAPIIFDRDLGGYRFIEPDNFTSFNYELPGLWFSSMEIQALLTMHQLLSEIDTSGLLRDHINPLLSRLNILLSVADDSADEVRKRIKIRMLGVRQFSLKHFELLGAALLKRKRLMIHYFARGSGHDSHREISPQRLIYYQGNWNLDAWCHSKNELRTFAVDNIHQVDQLAKNAKDVLEKSLDEALGAGYGIFAGNSVQWATLIFSPEASRWVKNQCWHSDQKGRILEDGSYELSIPYSNDTELLMDILRYGAKVEIISPISLREKLLCELATMKELYSQSLK